MSYSEIYIYRDLPVINNYVQVPPNRESEKTSVLESDAEDALEVVFEVDVPQTKSLSLGSGRQFGSKIGAQRFLRLPGINPDQWYRDVSGDGADPAEVVREA